MPIRRRDFTRALAALPACVSAASAPWEWSHYAGGVDSSRYAPLDQIHSGNVSGLRVAWQLETLPPRTRPVGMIQSNPIVVNGVMYAPGYDLHTYAIEAHTGKVLWTNKGLTQRRGAAAGVSRGVMYWKSGATERIFAPVREHILAIDAKTGELVKDFGDGGGIELRRHLDRDLNPATKLEITTPGVIFEDMIITGFRPGEGPREEAPGHILAFDCHTGKRRWIFHTIPHPGEFGYDTWPKDAWQHSGGANCWGGLSLDRARGRVYVATGSPTFDFWGGDRKGQNLFGNCVLCLDARTGRRIWHYQTVHHDLFDYDLPCAPNLVTVRHNGRMVDAVAQVSKMGWVFLLHRDTGKPLYPIEERAVPKSTVPGEESWPTQPFVTKPPPFSRQQMTPRDVARLSEESAASLKERLKDVELAPIFTPPRLDKEIMFFPGFHGGANWGGASWIQEKGVMFVNHNEIPWSLKLVKAATDAGHPYEITGYLRPEDKDGYAAISPPWGRISAIDLNKAEILWQVPVGEYKDLSAKGMKPTGSYNRGGNIATKGGLLFSATALDNMLRAYDQRNGNVLWQHELGGGGFATPCTYEADSRQFVVIATSPREVSGKGVRAGFTAFSL
ncbi:MAG: pyrroloquinoline quinone-dependent dehydrogenase [Bryobacteraceae bacterium]